MRLLNIFRPLKFIRYFINIVRFKRIGKHPVFADYIEFKNSKNVEAGNYCTFGKGVCLETGKTGKISIGNNVELSRYILLSALASIEIGDDTLIGEFTSIRDSDHGICLEEGLIRAQKSNSRAIRIGNDVWIGRGCAILKGVVVGDGAIVGANSVLTKDVEPNTVVAGCPAKFIKRRI